MARKPVTSRQRVANGEGSVSYDKKRQRWQGRVTIGVDANGNYVRRKVVGHSEGAVRQRMRELHNAVDNGAMPAPRTLTVGRYLDAWLETELPGTVALATFVQYEGIVTRYLKPALGKKPLTTLTPRDVSAMLRRLEQPTAERPNGYSYTTLRLCRAVLRRALAGALEEGLVMRNVAAIAKPPRSERKEGRTLTPDQARQFLATIVDHPDRAAFTVALLCGLRISELLGLSWDHVDLEGGGAATIKIRRSLKFIPGAGLVLSDTKTAKSRRTIVLPELARTVLLEHRRKQIATRLAASNWPERPLNADLVFRATNGQPRDPSNFRKALSDATTTAGLGHWHPHELRHSAASLLLAQGVQLKQISDMLGHSSITITADIYSHLLDEARAEVASAMDRIVGAAT